MKNLLISMVATFLFWWTKQIFSLVIKLEPLLLSWLQPRKSNCVPTELDVSILAKDWPEKGKFKYWRQFKEMLCRGFEELCSMSEHTQLPGFCENTVIVLKPF